MCGRAAPWIRALQSTRITLSHSYHPNRISRVCVCVHRDLPVRVWSLLLLPGNPAGVTEKAAGKSKWLNQCKQQPYFHVNVSSNKILTQEVIKEQPRKKKKKQHENRSPFNHHRTQNCSQMRCFFQKFSMRCPLGTAENTNCIQTHI